MSTRELIRIYDSLIGEADLDYQEVAYTFTLFIALSSLFCDSYFSDWKVKKIDILRHEWRYSQTLYKREVKQ